MSPTKPATLRGSSKLVDPVAILSDQTAERANRALQIEFAVEQVRASWAGEAGFTPATLEKVGEAVSRFARRVQQQGVADLGQITTAHCQGFVDATGVNGRAPE